MFSSHKLGDQNLKFLIYNQTNSWASRYDEHSLCNN